MKTEGSYLPALLSLIKIAAILFAASSLGNWFLSEIKKAKALKLPWYVPYLSIPGLLILIAIFVPVVLWVIHR